MNSVPGMRAERSPGDRAPGAAEAANSSFFLPSPLYEEPEGSSAFGAPSTLGFEADTGYR